MKIICPHCGKQLNAPPEAAGRIAQCNGCSNRFRVPLPTAEAVHEPLPPLEPQRPAFSIPDFIGDDPPSPEPFDTIPVDRPPAIIQRAFEAAPYSGKIHVITERTSKRYKGIQAGGCFLMVIAILVAASATDNGIRTGETNSHGFAGLFLLGGLIMLLVGRVLAWWHHG